MITTFDLKPSGNDKQWLILRTLLYLSTNLIFFSIQYIEHCKTLYFFTLHLSWKRWLLINLQINIVESETFEEFIKYYISTVPTYKQKAETKEI